MKKVLLSLLLTFFLLINYSISYGEKIASKEIKTTLLLEEAVEEAIKNSQELEINKLDIDVKDTELSEANYKEKKYKKMDFSMGTVEEFLLDESMLSKQAEYAYEEERLKTNYIKEDIKYNVTNAYYGVLQMEDYLQVTKSTLENIERNNKIINKKFELGMSSKSDVLMSDIGLNEAYTNIDKAEEDLEKAYRGLNMLLDYPLDTKLKLVSSFEEQVFERDIDEDLKTAYEKRFDIIQLKNNFNLLKLDFDVSKKVYPSNTFVYKYKNSSLAKVENLLSNYKKNIEFDIKSKYDEIKGAEKQIKLAEATVKKAEEGLRLRELAYNAGTGIVLEVKEATTQLYNSRLALTNAIANYNLKILEYDKAVNIGVVR